MAYDMVGGSSAFYRMPKNQRLEIRDAAAKLYDLDLTYRKAGEALERVVAGSVYIITNPAWPEWVKIGKAGRLDERLDTFQTGSPFRDYVVEYSHSFPNALAVETLLHQRLAHCRGQGEWFHLTVKQAKAALYAAWAELG